MGKMHELLAVEADVTSIATKLVEEAATTFAKKPDHFKGLAKNTTMLDDKRSGENTTDAKEVVTTVDDKLSYVLASVAKMYDVNLQKEATNQTAKADLIVKGKTLAKDVPATFLLGMETRLKVIRELVGYIPTLEPAIAWVEDATKGKGIYRSPILTTFRNEKKIEYITLAPATDKHPAQVKDWTADVPVARVDTTNFSGMWTTKKKAEVLDNIDALIQGIKQARQRANLAEVVPVKIGDELVKFILG